VPLLLKLETDGYPIRAIEGQVAVAQIALPGSHFPEVPAAPSAILPDAIFPRRIISYSIANYRMLSGRRFLTRFDLSGMPREGLRTTFGNNQMILSFRTIIDFYNVFLYVAILLLLISLSCLNSEYKIRNSQD